jgi:hypothetical protein
MDRNTGNSDRVISGRKSPFRENTFGNILGNTTDKRSLNKLAAEGKGRKEEKDEG